MLKLSRVHFFYPSVGQDPNAPKTPVVSASPPTSPSARRGKRVGVVSLSNAVAASGTHNAMLGLRAFMDRKERGNGMGWFPSIPRYLPLVKIKEAICVEGFYKFLSVFALLTSRLSTGADLWWNLFGSIEISQVRKFFGKAFCRGVGENGKTSGG